MSYSNHWSDMFFFHGRKAGFLRGMFATMAKECRFYNLYNWKEKLVDYLWYMGIIDFHIHKNICFLGSIFVPLVNSRIFIASIPANHWSTYSTYMVGMDTLPEANSKRAYKWMVGIGIFSFLSGPGAIFRCYVCWWFRTPALVNIW